MSNTITMNCENFTAVNTYIENTKFNNETLLKVVKANKIMEFDENTYAKLKNLQFHNGVIEIKMLSKLLQDAPDFARGFIGIVFRIYNDEKFEALYLRPTNGRACDDLIRKNRGCQYFSYPQFKFDYFRENGIIDYEAPADIDLDEWIVLKAVINDASAKLYVNDNLALTVNDMKHGADLKGSIGLFVDIGTEAYFKDLKITSVDL